jgi:hypothetical protein
VSVLSPAARNLDTAGQKMVCSRISRMTKAVELELKLKSAFITRLIKCRNLLSCFRANHGEGMPGLVRFPVFPPIGR